MFAARYTLCVHAPWHARSLLIVPQGAEEIFVFEVFRGSQHDLRSAHDLHDLGGRAIGNLGRRASAARSNCASWRAGKLELDKCPPTWVSGKIPSSRREVEVTFSRKTSSQEGS